MSVPLEQGNGTRRALHEDPGNVDVRIALERAKLYVCRAHIGDAPTLEACEELAPASQELLTLQFTDASVRDILDVIGAAAGITILYDPEFQDRTYSVQLDGVTLEEALKVILTANQYFYKVVTPHAIRATSNGT